jgi:DNA-binding CsgD family transcriptional regulator
MNKHFETQSFTNPRGMQLKPLIGECIFRILLGKTIKEIAYELNLSHRTIEEYINKLKRDFNCTSKSQLISKLIQNHNNKDIIISFLINYGTSY